VGGDNVGVKKALAYLPEPKDERIRATGIEEFTGYIS